MLDYRNLKIGDKLHFHSEEFDGVSDVNGVVTEVEVDHAIMKSDGISYWIDDYTADLFSREGGYEKNKRGY